MSRLISNESQYTIRAKLLQTLLVTIHELGKKEIIDDEARDMTAYILLTLQSVTESIEKTSQAWEKRDYWIKADRFRSDWSWANKYSKKLREALQIEDWSTTILWIVNLVQQVAGLVKYKEAKGRNNYWEGCWKKLNLK